MSIQALQEFVGRHMVSAGVLPALAVALDVKANGATPDPMLAARVQDLLAAVGAGDLLGDVEPQEAAMMLAMIRHSYLLDATLLFAHTRTTAWNHAEPEILESTGEVARLMHAQAVTRAVVPACEGLADRFRSEDACMLDAGVGVAGSAIALAQMWPELRIVGVDVWEPSLRIARENVDRAGLAGRIELRQQGVEALEDQAAFDYVYYANVFMPEQNAVLGLERSLQALRPGGWISVGVLNEGAPAPLAALFRLRETVFGGPGWTEADAHRLLLDAGFVDVRALPTPPGALVTWIVGRREPV